MNYHNITVDDMLNGDVAAQCSGFPAARTTAAAAKIRKHGTTRAVSRLTKPQKKSFLPIFRGIIWMRITFSGGDPLCPANRETVGRSIAETRDRFPQKTIWLYTGDLFESFRDTLPFLPLIDVIVDGPYVEALRDVNLRWRGSKNQRVIDVKQTLATGKVVLWARN